MKPVDRARRAHALREHRRLTSRRNRALGPGNSVLQRYRDPVLTAEHVPPQWRYDFNPDANPLFLERLGVNSVFNPGAIELDGRILLVARVEGVDRKSFFAVAESRSGVDGFRFWDEPVLMPEADAPDGNIYDMRLTKHEDGWIYGLFCTERRDPRAAPGDVSAAVAQCGIARTRDLKSWRRLPDLETNAPQQRNVVLHPEFVDGKYALYTRPSDGFMEVGSAGGIGWGLCDSMEYARIGQGGPIVDPRAYHTVKEAKNGQGPAPIKTAEGWLHIAHGVRNTAAGMRYVLYAFLSKLDEPWLVTHRPGGYLLAPEGSERVGDVSNVLFCNGAVTDGTGRVLLYYASSDTRVHVATSTVERLLDYVINTPEDAGGPYACVQQRLELIRSNRDYLSKGQ